MVCHGYYVITVTNFFENKRKEDAAMSEEQLNSKQEQPKRKRGRPPKNTNKNEIKPNDILTNNINDGTHILHNPYKDNSQTVEKRNRGYDIRDFHRLKELALQNPKKGSGNRNRYYVSNYTKKLIRDFLLNPYAYSDKIRGVSNYLFRSNTLYKKIILYYACMPLYNYNVFESIDFNIDYDFEESRPAYQKIIQRLHNINIRDTFSQILAMSLINGCYFGFIYNQYDNGLFIHSLNPDFCKIKGKNEEGIWMVAFDMTFFLQGNNREFVEGIDGDMRGCWDEIFIDAWNEYKSDRVNSRWLILPPERTMCIPNGLDDEFDVPLPFMLGTFLLLMDVDDYAGILADKAVLENYKLLLSKIPLISGTNNVDDFAVSLELVQEMQALIDAAVPENVGTAYSPLDLEVVSFENSNTTNDADMVSTSIKNVFDNCGASQLVVAGGESTSATGLKQAIANDMSFTFLLVSRIEKNFNYFIKKNWHSKYSIRVHEQTWYNKDDYISQMKDAATLGADPMEYLTAIGKDPYVAWCGLVISKSSGIRDLMIPLQSTYTMSAAAQDRAAGRPSKDEDELSEEGLATREGEKNAETKAKNEI